MKQGIHPQMFQATYTCTSCGAVFTIPSTVEEVHTEVCSSCHPVYTGKFRAVASSGRVERFQKKMTAAKEAKATAKPKKRRLTEEEKLEKKAKEKAEELAEKKKEKEEKEREKKLKEAKKTVKKTTAKKASPSARATGDKPAKKTTAKKATKKK